MDTQPTAEVIRKMAEKMEATAAHLKMVANSLEKSQDFTYAAEATNAVANLIPNLRLDLLVTRPLREYQKV